MWLFTRYGFFSVVCARQGDGSHVMPVDPDRMMVRARVVVAIAEETDYDNFKKSAKKQKGGEGIEYLNALHAVWSVLNKLQR